MRIFSSDLLPAHAAADGKKDMTGPFEWRINDIERKAENAERRLYELDSLRSDVACLERTNGQLRAEVDGLRAELQACTSRLQTIEEVMNQLQETSHDPPA